MPSYFTALDSARARFRGLVGAGMAKLLYGGPSADSTPPATHTVTQQVLRLVDEDGTYDATWGFFVYRGKAKRPDPLPPDAGENGGGGVWRTKPLAHVVGTHYILGERVLVGADMVFEYARPFLRITAMTRANPVAITTETAHGYSTGDTVIIWDSDNPTQLNNAGGGTPYTITVTGASTFTLDGIDGTGWAAYTPAVAYVRVSCKAFATDHAAGWWKLPSQTPTAHVVGRAYVAGDLVVKSAVAYLATAPTSTTPPGASWKAVTLPPPAHVPSGSYAFRELCFDTAVRAVFRAKVAHSGVATAPNADATNWERVGNLPPAFANSTVMYASDVIRDPEWSSYHQARLSFTTQASGTCAQDRAVSPARWTTLNGAYWQMACRIEFPSQTSWRKPRVAWMTTLRYNLGVPASTPRGTGYMDLVAGEGVTVLDWTTLDTTRDSIFTARPYTMEFGLFYGAGSNALGYAVAQDTTYLHKASLALAGYTEHCWGRVYAALERVRCRKALVMNWFGTADAATWFTAASAGAAPADLPLAPGTREIVTDATLGVALQMDGIGIACATKATVPATAGVIYGLEITGRAVTNPTDGTGTLTLQCHALDAGGALIGTVSAAVTITVAEGVKTARAFFSNTSSTGVTAWSGGAATLRFGFTANAGEAGAPRFVASRFHLFRESDAVLQDFFVSETAQTGALGPIAASATWRAAPLIIQCDYEAGDQPPDTKAAAALAGLTAIESAEGFAEEFGATCRRWGARAWWLTNDLSILSGISAANGITEASIGPCTSHLDALTFILDGGNFHANSGMADLLAGYYRLKYTNGDPAQPVRAQWNPAKFGFAAEMADVGSIFTWCITDVTVDGANGHVTIKTQPDAWRAGAYGKGALIYSTAVGSVLQATAAHTTGASEAADRALGLWVPVYYASSQLVSGGYVHIDGVQSIPQLNGVFRVKIGAVTRNTSFVIDAVVTDVPLSTTVPVVQAIDGRTWPAYVANSGGTVRTSGLSAVDWFQATQFLESVGGEVLMFLRATQSEDFIADADGVALLDPPDVPILEVTLTNPVRCRAPGHDLSTTDAARQRAWIDGPPGREWITGQTFVVADVDGDWFSLLGFDGAGITGATDGLTVVPARMRGTGRKKLMVFNACSAPPGVWT